MEVEAQEATAEAVAAVEAAEDLTVAEAVAEEDKISFANHSITLKT